MDFQQRLQQGVVLFDGAMGTQIQALKPTAEEWDGKMGCSEVLNLTAPEKIQAIHEAYLAVGADVVETNTFGANEIVLSEYGLQERVEDINRIAVEIARRAAERYSSNRQRFVAGSVGPGTKLISLGQTDFETMYRSYSRQASGLIAGGVDLFIIETCQDLLQIKTALLAITDAMNEKNVKLPLIVSVTVETTGTLLVGSEIGAVLATLEPFNITALGMNCATGPQHMRPYIRQICQQFEGAVICQPNAGLPQNINGEMVYTISIDDFVTELTDFIVEYGVQIVGGCCGTTPDFIKTLAERIKTIAPTKRNPGQQPAVASLFSAQTMHQDPAPFFIGERTNTNGSKKFREYLLNDNWDGVVAVAQQQQRSGAHGLDLCVAYTGRDEIADMRQAVTRIARQVNLPLFIDSTNPVVIETALKLFGGRAVINSINLEDGEQRAAEICRLAKRYGAALIALTIDEKGMALTVERKVEIARRLFTLAVEQYGLRPQDLIFDPLTFTLGSGDETLRNSALNTINAISEIKATLPGVFTNLGISNVSFGLNPAAREILNSVFLAEAVKAGLDMAIVNVKKILPLYQIDEADREYCLNLIYNRGKNPLIDFINYFQKKQGVERKTVTDDAKLSLDEKIKQRIINGNSAGLEKLLQQALVEKKPLAIINELLIPAMKKVGDLFAAGEMQLPFVLQSAEVMKFAVDKLQPFMEKSEERQQTSIVIATVRGDVHDIGKNLVDIILSNNGYRVYNLGIKCEIDTIIEKAIAVDADAIGMSGLLVKSTIIMKENLEELQRRNLHFPVLLGGAALTRSYVEDICQPILNAPVIYCRDAFEGLQIMEAIKHDELQKYNEKNIKVNSITKQSSGDSKLSEIISPASDIPQPPFWGDKIVRDIDLDAIFPYLNETVLFRSRWGYHRGKQGKKEYENFIATRVRPELAELKQRCREEKLLQPAVVYGYYPCNREGDQLIIFDPDNETELLRFNFPRQSKPPHRSIVDYFLPLEAGQRDIIALQVVTMGYKAAEESQRLFKADHYKEYLLFHGLSVETTEALAEYWHQKIRAELQIDRMRSSIKESQPRSLRYSFGYPACPDLTENRKIFIILKPERIGVTITEHEQMVPEQTTSAFIVHHPQARYFRVKA